MTLNDAYTILNDRTAIRGPGEYSKFLILFLFAERKMFQNPTKKIDVRNTTEGVKVAVVLTTT